MVSYHAVANSAQVERIYGEPIHFRKNKSNNRKNRNIFYSRIFTSNSATSKSQQIESQDSAWPVKKSPTTEDTTLSNHHNKNQTTTTTPNNYWKLYNQFSKQSSSKINSKRLHESLLDTINLQIEEHFNCSAAVIINNNNNNNTSSSSSVYKGRKSFNFHSPPSGCFQTNMNNQSNNNITTSQHYPNKIKTLHHTKPRFPQSTSNTTDTFPSSYIYSILEKLSPCPDFNSYIEIKWITTITQREIQVELFRPKVLNMDSVEEEGLVSTRKIVHSPSPAQDSQDKSKSKNKFLQATVSKLKRRVFILSTEQVNTKKQDTFKDEESSNNSSSGEDYSTTTSGGESCYSSHHCSESDDYSSSGQESYQSNSYGEHSVVKSLDFHLEQQITSNNYQETSCQKRKKDFLVQGGVLRLPTALNIFSKLFNSMKSKLSLNKYVLAPFGSDSDHSTDYQGGSSSSGSGTGSSEGLSSSSEGGNSSSNSSGDERDDVSEEGCEDQNEDSYTMPPINVLTASGESVNNSHNGGGSSNSSERRNNNSTSNNGGNSSSNNNNNNNNGREASSNSMNNSSSSGSEEFSGGSDSDDENPSFATVQIIDGSQKEKNGIKYWVQRNVITIQVISSFVFDTCTVYCTKEGSTENKVMETLSFVDSFTKLNPSKVSDILKNAQCTLSIDQDDVYEAQFRKKLPFTSGRPETQKLIWISAEFLMSKKIIKKVHSPKFYVCSRPQDLRAIGNTPVAPSSSNVSNSAQTTNNMSNSMNSHHENSMSQQQHSFSARTKVATSQLNVQSPSMNSNTVPNFQNDGYRHSSNNSQDNSSSNIHNSTTNRSNLQNYNTFSTPSNTSGSMIHHHYSNQSSNSNTSNNAQQQMFPSNQYSHPFTSPNSPLYQQQQQQHHHSQQSSSYQPSSQQNVSIQMASIHPNRGPLNGQQEVTLIGNFEAIKRDPNSVRVMFGLQDSPNIRQVLSDRIVCTVPERIVPGLVRIEVVTKSIPQLSSFGDVFYTYCRQEQHQQENENQVSDNEGFTLNRSHHSNKPHTYHPYK